MPYSPAKPLPWSATLCVGRDCAHFWHILFFFFFIFSLFFVRAAGAGSGTLKVRTLRVCCLTQALLLPAALAGDQNQENGHRPFSLIYGIQ